MTLLSAALDYAEAGWPVLALHSASAGRCSCRRSGCSSPGKHPRLEHGVKDATLDRRQIETWWRRWPESNIGLRTGAVSGLVVVDVDGDEGEASIRALQRRHGPLPGSGWVRTGGGGWHLYLEHPGGPLGNTCRRLGPKLDTRGDGGYVVAPPSRHVSTMGYSWWTGRTVAPMPAWLLGLLRPPTPKRRPLLRVGQVGDAYASAAMRSECSAVATAVIGGRNHILNRAAFNLGQLVAVGRLDEAVVTEALVGAAEHAGLGRHEAERTVASGLGAGQRQPRVFA